MAFSEIIVTFCFLVCLQNLVADGGPVNSKQVAEGIDYLTKFGYLMNDDPRTGKLRTRQDLEKSIKMLQRYANLPETGRMDAATIALMGKSRCGVADYGNYNSDNTRRKKRYTLQGTYWKKRDLTYKIKSFTRDIPSQEKQRQIFKKSFDMWSAASNIRVTENPYANDKDRSHLGQRRSYASIRAMTQDYQRQDEPREPGKDGTLEKRRLQDRHAYGFGNALPTSKAPPGHWLPEASVPSVPASAEQRSQRAQETLAADIVGSVRERQQELASVEETLTKMERGPPVWRHRDIAKMNSLQKRRMALRNGITRDVKDLEKFIELTN